MDVDDNAYYEAEGPFVCIYVKTWMDLRCSDVYIIWDSECSPKIGIDRSETKGSLYDLKYIGC